MLCPIGHQLKYSGNTLFLPRPVLSLTHLRSPLNTLHLLLVYIPHMAMSSNMKFPIQLPSEDSLCSQTVTLKFASLNILAKCSSLHNVAEIILAEKFIIWKKNNGLHIA